MPAQPDNPAADQSQRSSRISPLFWVCLLISAALYAPCALASRVVAWAQLQQKHDRNQAELIAAQQEVQHLQRVGDALEADPVFAAQLAARPVRPASPTPDPAVTSGSVAPTSAGVAESAVERRGT